MMSDTEGKSLLVPGLLVALGVALLLGLGTWQVYRLHWKEGILARIDAAEREPPRPLGPNPSAYDRVAVTGRFRYDQAVNYAVDVRDTPKGPVMGHYQLVPLQRDAGPALLVNRGWVPETANTQVNQPPGTVTVTGYVRPAEKSGLFTPADDPAQRQFYALNPVAIGQAEGFGPVLPFSLTVLGRVPEGQYPIPASDLPRPPNNHLSYAITWYSLAAALIAIFIARIRSGRVAQRNAG